MPNKYFRVWNPEVLNVQDTYDFCEINQITEENGYSTEDIQDIKKLELGEVWYSKEYGKDHTIIRAR